MAQELTWVVESRYSLNSSFYDEFFEWPSPINLGLFLLLLNSIELNSTNSIECVRFKPVTMRSAQCLSQAVSHQQR